ncbi:hypothetical protein CERSUDRAFT_97283 [Gelatoporia subvermispora B]|uniref:Mid2 domain-containing protein n=1 Tax=Ceriporiopsis subvermispora (strain B) TaxID=914234 RepID=M2PFI9_CERS8|nr:hypothetical protein CERSUDRAFT_97283 [Gelatoporia subvermispora B]
MFRNIPGHEQSTTDITSPVGSIPTSSSISISPVDVDPTISASETTSSPPTTPLTVGSAQSASPTSLVASLPSSSSPSPSSSSDTISDSSPTLTSPAIVSTPSPSFSPQSSFDPPDPFSASFKIVTGIPTEVPHTLTVAPQAVTSVITVATLPKNLSSSTAGIVSSTLSTATATSGHSIPVDVVVGGVIGIALGLIFLLFAVVWWIQRRNNRKEDFRTYSIYKGHEYPAVAGELDSPALTVYPEFVVHAEDTRNMSQGVEVNGPREPSALGMGEDGAQATLPRIAELEEELPPPTNLRVHNDSGIRFAGGQGMDAPPAYSSG